MNIKNKKIFLYSLGCAKNLVDGEYMSALLRQAGFGMTGDPAEAEIIIVNTCGFIESAKKESIEAILEMADYKNDGRCELLIVSGCLSERYASEMQDAMPEVDAILGVKNYKDIVKAATDFYEEKERAEAGGAENADDDTKEGGRKAARIYKEGDRSDVLSHMKDIDHVPSTDYYAYLKIAEGCSNHCAFCAIPGIRGPFRSRPEEEILDEAANLIFQGYDELIVIAQDSGFYGLDLYHERRLPDLLKKLSELNGLKWIRVLYLYAEGLSDELLDVYAEHDNLVPYFDMPIQHASDKILSSMDRSETQESLRQTFRKIRRRLPEAVLRTTVMVGYPGETDEDFAELLDFIKEVRFDMLGCFKFCPEEGTRAALLPNQVDEDTKQARYDKLMEVQKIISKENAERFVGRILDVKLEDISSDGLYYLGRSAFQTPEVDSSVWVLNTKEGEPIIGSVVKVKIIEAESYEMTGVTV